VSNAWMPCGLLPEIKTLRVWRKGQPLVEEVSE
jgi:hypothetical protein